MPPALTQAPQLESIIQKANDRAKKFNRPQNVVDLLIEIVGLEKYRRLFQSFNLNPDAIVISLGKLPEVVPGCVETKTAKKEYAQIIKYSKDSANDLKFGFVDVEHVFHQLLNSSVTIRAWAEIAELPIDAIIERMQTWLTLEDQRGEELSNEMLQPDFPTIEQYCINLNEKVANDDSFCYGREKEINQILDIICRQKKSNVLLIGEPGVGRKTIVQGAIEKILSGGASEILKGKEFFLVELSKMMAGTAMFGSLESRFVNLIKEAEEHGQCVLVIDNFSQAFDGETKGSKSEIANLLRPILDKPGVSVIGICTQGEYKRVEKESALSRFEVIKVSEPSKEETRAILINSISELEYYHHVDLPVSTIDTILDLCEKFIPYKKFPEKAFDFLDHLGARAKNKHFVRPESLTKLENKLAETFDPTAEKDSPLYKKMESLIERYGKAFNKWMNRVDTTVPVISAQEAVSTFAEKHGITENQLKQLQNSSVETIRERIKEQVFGQDHAIDKVMDVLLCSKVGLREKNKPLAKFLFVGQSSVGKAQPLYSKIKTKIGWVTMGEISVGDKILDVFGQEQIVEAVFPQETPQKVFKIETMDGRTCSASDNHLWRVYNCNWKKGEGRWKILNTLDVKSLLDKGNNIYIELPYQSHNDCSNNADLPIHPYVLGVLIGDGCLGRTIALSSNDPEIIENCKSLIGPNQEIVKEKGDNYDFYFRERKPLTNRQNKKGVVLTQIKVDLENLGLLHKRSWEKFIPEQYMNGSFQQRLDILNGILDTDGTISKNGSISITTSSSLLAKDIQRLAWSIGAVANFYSYSIRKTYTYKGEKRVGREHFRVSIRHATPSIFFKLQRKRDRIPTIYSYENPLKGTKLKVRLKSVNLLGEEEVKCIKVSSPNSLYITDDFIVTHNTEIGKQLALSFFGDEKNLLKLDMSEFQERGSASSMIGTSAGYIGYGDGGRLTEFVKHNANCVVLFDEVEKAHPDILNLMLQIMDDGYITDGQGYRVDFTNTIIIATSNIGAGAPKSSVGFIDSKKDGQGFLDAVKKEFKPEWLARLDEIVVFNSMTDDMLQKILNKYLSSTIQKLASDILVTIDDSVKVSLLKKLKEEDSHARNVQATIRREIEVPLAKYIIQNRPKQITVTFDAEKKQICLL